MSSIENLQLFLRNYLSTKNISWLELFIFEFYQRNKQSKELLLTNIQGNEKFMALSLHMSYHLLKLLFSTICELMTTNDADKDAVSVLRNFLTNGLGSRIITMMSTDLDLSAVTNERELVVVLTKIFPTECWEADEGTAHLQPLMQADYKTLYKRLWLLNPTKSNDAERESVRRRSRFVITEVVEGETKSCEEFFTDEFENRHLTMQLSSSQMAQKVVEILKKLVGVENANSLGQTDQNSVTMSCLSFSLDTLGHLQEQKVFNDGDQTVINANLLELAFLCFNNLVNRDGKSIEPVFKKLFRLLEVVDSPEVSCGLVLNILTVLSNLCVKNSLQKSDNLKMFTLCNHLITRRMKILGGAGENLHTIQLLLIKIVRNVRVAHMMRNCEKKKRRRRKDDFIAHHECTSDACTFEALLIESCGFIRRFAHLKAILGYFRTKDICCCNSSIDTIRMFMAPSTVPAQLLNIVHRKIFKPMFGKSKICLYCNDKINSEVFQDEYFSLLRGELYRRQGWELHALLHHLTKIQRLFTGSFLHNFVFKVIVPVFHDKKIKFLQNTEENFEAKLIVTACLEIFNDCMKDETILVQFFTKATIHNIKDCSLIPAMAGYACQLLKTASDNIKLIGEDEDGRESIAKLINSILFTNVLYLTHELMEIYDQIDLPKDVPIVPEDDAVKPAEKPREDAFEILDETVVAVKEPLSDLDVLLLNTIHWNIICDLITRDPAFQVEFVANIFNNFSGNILFTIAYNALNSILLKKELRHFQLRVVSREPNMGLVDLPVIFERCELRTPVLVARHDLDFREVVERCYQLYEIAESELDKLRAQEISKIFRVARDNGAQFRSFVHKNIFLTDNVCDDPSRRQQIVGDHVVSYHNWLNQIWLGIYEGHSSIRNRFIQVINRFVRTEEEIKAIHRLNLIKDITDKRGVKYLSSISRNCFDICWRLSDNISFTAKMSTALDELKLLLLQDSWDGNREAMVDVLQLLLGVAEMKASGVSRMMFMDPENHLSGSSESMFSDFNSSLERVSFEERSDGESSSDKKTETYYTADENYDGDGELCSNADTDMTQSFRTCSLPATLGLRNTNEHICKLVVEILMDLSKRCVERPDQWQPDILIPLAQRLSCMKHFLGGSEFLIRGFSAVLQSKNVQLTALQKTVLELVEDLNTTGAFKAFLSVLTSNDAAIDLIMARFETLCNKEAIPRPFIKINYPTVASDATVTSNCDTHLHRLIQSFRDVHSSNKLLTPFTEASQIIPLNFLDFKPWNSLGFTISAWVELPAAENTMKSAHLVALGSEKLMMAFYINSDGSFGINVMKPNQNFSSSGSKVHKTPAAGASSNKENVNKTNIFGIALATLKESELPNVRTRGFLKKKVPAAEDDSTRRLKTSKISVKSKRVRLKVGQWTQVCFSARCSENEIMLLITVDGTEQELIEIPIDGMRESEINGMLQLLCVGSQKQANADSLQYSISNVMLFRWPLDSPSQTSHLHSLGPDCDSLIDCEAVEVKPLLSQVDFMQVTKTVANLGSDEYSLRLKAGVLVVYSANTAISYNTSDHGKPMEVFTIGKIPVPIAVPSLARSIYFCGGLSTLLILFARTIEMTDDPVTQSTALYTLLKMSFGNNHLFAEFEQKNLFNLIAHVFKHSSCYRGPGMLKAILDVIYGGTMFNRKSRTDDFQINERSVLNIEHPKLLLKLLENFDIFLSPDKNEGHILDVLFKSLMVVVRENHPYRRLNRQCLVDHDFYAKLIEFCKTHLANSSNAIAITPKTALVIVELLKMMSNDQPVMWTMTEIQKLLLLLHHPSESFVTHDRTKFHFILAGNKPNKSSKLSLSSSKGSKYFNFSIKIRSNPVPTSPSSPPQTPRSPTGSMSLHPEMSGSTRSLRSSVAASPTRKKSALKFDELNESQTQTISKALADDRVRKDLQTPTKLRLRRLRHTPKRSPFKKLKMPPKGKTDDEVDSDDQHLAETFRALMTASTAPSVISEVDSSRYESGVSVLQENLFEILRGFVVLLDDTKAEFDLPECLKMEILIMFANHHDANVRAAIIELIEAVTSRESPDLIAKFEKSNFWAHLGNQLTISPVNMRMAQACMDWICYDKTCIQEMSRSQKIRVKYRPAFNVLIAMLPSMTHDHNVMGSTTRFFRVLLETQPECMGPPLISALITSAIKALMKLERRHERVKESLLMLLEQIASRSMTSSGTIQPLWDILYGLTFIERQKKREVVREVHVTILKQLIALCITEQNRRGSRAGDVLQSQLVVTQNLGTLPASEIKTRFNLIHDRAVQFVSSWDPSEELAACEHDFVKYLVDLHFAGIYQGSSIILWALNPVGDAEVKDFVIQKLSNMLGVDGNFVIPGNDTKLIKSLLLQYLNDHSKDAEDETIRNITKFCGVAVNQQSMTWSWNMSAVEKIHSMRQSSQKDQNSNIEKIVYRLETQVQSCIESAMKMTRSVVDAQNKERRLLMNQLKKSQEMDFYREWFELIQRMVHEDAPWYSPDLYPSTWELDETEGPGRTRIRLKRSVLQIDEKFFADEFKQKAAYQHRKPLLNYLLRPKETERYSIRDRIVFTFNAKHLTMELEIAGEVIVTDNQLIFLANADTYINSIICDLKNIHEIWDRRYQHKEVAMEIFLANRSTFFIIFETNYERDIVKKFVSDKIARKTNTQPGEALQKWIDGRSTCYEYLIELNKIAGRSYNDLMQYPVFPWILTDYHSEFLDLKKRDTFRKLNKTISTQYEDMEEHYVTNYKYLAQSMADQPSVMKPYHYSSHYSNSGSILHFLVRLPPYTNMFLLYQDHNFDIPDRTFHSLATTYRLTSKESATDVKELIPEFFFMFDFFENSEGFNYGRRQSGDLVNDVKLPAWCDGSARLFMLIHRQALECDLVRKQLHNWIDLIFGYKQKGNAAVNAVNVFHPATYPEFQITNITDAVERSAFETMIRTYGQMPKQIFTSSHKKSSYNSEPSTESWPVLKTVKGLRWGSYTGSPQLLKPRKIDSLKCGPRISKFVLIEDQNMFYGLPEKCHLMRSTRQENQDLVLWSESDGVIRVKSLKDSNERTRKLFHISPIDPVTACGSHVKHSSLWFGHESGNISVYTRTDEKSPEKPPKKSSSRNFNDALEAIIGISEVGNATEVDDEAPAISKWNYPIVLVKHHGEVLDLKICIEFQVVVSISVDGRAVIWDAQKIEYIRTIEPSCNTLKSQLTLVEVSPTLGDILTVFTPRNAIDVVSDEENFEVLDESGDDFINVSMAIGAKSQLRLHTINAKYINHTIVDSFITSAGFSFIKEGTGVNVIAVGFDNGTIRLYSTWTLELIREIATGKPCEISEIIYTTHQHLTFLSDQDIQVWESEGLAGEPPKFNSIVLY